MAAPASRIDGAATDRWIIKLVLFLTLPLGTSLVLAAVNYRLMHIPTGSMLPTLKTGQYIVISRAAFGISRVTFDGVELPIVGRWLAPAQPERGAIIVFRLQSDRKTIYVKRVVGVAGDRVAMKGGQLQLNGSAVPAGPATEPGAGGQSPVKPVADRFIEHLPGATFPNQILRGAGGNSGFSFLTDTEPVVVPNGSIFVLGDNRDNSVDSRSFGPVPVDLVVGRVVWY